MADMFYDPEYCINCGHEKPLHQSYYIEKHSWKGDYYQPSYKGLCRVKKCDCAKFELDKPDFYAKDWAYE